MEDNSDPGPDLAAVLKSERAAHEYIRLTRDENVSVIEYELSDEGFDEIGVPHNSLSAAECIGTKGFI